MSDSRFLVCPACERTEPATEPTACPDCGSERTYLNHQPALPDATTEAYVKLDADEAALESGSVDESGSTHDPDAPDPEA